MRGLGTLGGALTNRGMPTLQGAALSARGGVSKHHRNSIAGHAGARHGLFQRSLQAGRTSMNIGRLYLLKLWPERGVLRAALRAVEEDEPLRFDGVQALCDHLSRLESAARAAGGGNAAPVPVGAPPGTEPPAAGQAARSAPCAAAVAAPLQGV